MEQTYCLLTAKIQRWLAILAKAAETNDPRIERMMRACTKPTQRPEMRHDVRPPGSASHAVAVRPGLWCLPPSASKTRPSACTTSTHKAETTRRPAR